VKENKFGFGRNWMWYTWKTTCGRCPANTWKYKSEVWRVVRADDKDLFVITWQWKCTDNGSGHPGGDMHSVKKSGLLIKIWGKYNLKSGQRKWNWQRRLRRNSERARGETMSDIIWETIHGNISGERTSILDVAATSRKNWRHYWLVN